MIRRHSDRSRRARRWAWHPVLLLLAFCLLLAATAGRVAAVSPIEVTGESYDHVFGERLEFVLKARSAHPIVSVVLFYGQEGDNLVRRIYPQFEGDTDVTVDHVEQVERGQFAPGTPLRIWWQLSTDAGEELITQPQRLVYTHDEHDWQRMSGDGLDLYWYGSNAAERRADAIRAKAEQVLAQIEAEIGLEIEPSLSVYVYNGQRDMLPALASRSATYDERTVTLGVALDDDTLLLLGPHSDVELTVAHELSHIVVGVATDNPFVSLPRWLDEGLAMYAQGELPRDNAKALERGVQEDSLLSVRSMTSYPGRAEQVDMFYGEVYSLTEFMLEEYGRDKMSELLAAFGDGVPQQDALEQTYGFGLDELNTRWRASLGLESERPADAVADATDTAPLRRESSPPLCPFASGLVLLPLLSLVWVSAPWRRRDWD